MLLNAYGVDDPEVLNKLEDLAKRSKHRGWWLEHAEHLRPDYLDYIALEDDATYIREWQPVVVPGLLQTAAYVKAVIAATPHYVAPERIAQLVKVREARQAKIAEGGAMYTAILWEAVVRHPLISAEVHREQLAAILEVGQRRNVTVQVLPFSAGPVVAVTSAFQSFSFESEPTVEAVALENYDRQRWHRTSVRLLSGAQSEAARTMHRARGRRPVLEVVVLRQRNPVRRGRSHLHRRSSRS